MSIFHKNGITETERLRPAAIFCKDMSNRKQFTWVPWEFLQAQNVRPWRNMTVWQPPYGRTAGYQRRTATKAIAKGLTFRPLAVTACDTLDWHKSRPQKEQDATLNGEINGLAMSREGEVLAAWKAKIASGS